MFDPPTSLSPSRIEAFTSCPMQFRFSSIERLPEPASIHTAKGTLVHRVLELLFGLPAPERTRERAAEFFPVAWDELIASDEFRRMTTGPAEMESLRKDGRSLVERYFGIEDPTTIEHEGTELWLETQLGSLQLRGIIDRLDRRPDGTLAVVDYKTGRAPSPSQEQKRLGTMYFYAWLCEQALGERPSEVRLVYVASGKVISSEPSDQHLRYLPMRTNAIYQAIEKSCTTGRFATTKSKLCDFCAFRRWCPEFGGDPSRAAVEAPQVYGLPA